MRVAIIDPGSGNLASVSRALGRAAATAGLDMAAIITRDPAVVAAAERIVLPGQGAFAAVMQGLRSLPGMLDTLDRRRRDGTPLLGICVGMQVLARSGREHGTHAGLGWIDGHIAPMLPRGVDGAALPLPQMGWNTLELAQASHPLLAGITPGAHAYFVHSYALAGHDPADVLATTTYGGPVVAAIARGNLAGTQFHVEKSGELGLRLLTNFLLWQPVLPAAAERSHALVATGAAPP